MEERSRDVIGLLEELTEQNRQQTASLKKQLFVTRILAAAGCVLAAAVIAVFLLIVPPMLQIISQGQETLNPFKHFDPNGFLIMLYSCGYGWGKPVETSS